MVTDGRLELHIRTAPHSIRAYGELDYENCHELAVAIKDRLADCGNGRVDLDLGGLDFVDSSGVKTLIVSAQDARSGGCALRIVALTSQLDRALSMAGVKHMLEITGDPVDSYQLPALAHPSDQALFTIPADTASCCSGRDLVCQYALGLGFVPPMLDDIRLAAGEALSNAVRHGACGGRGIRIQCSKVDGGITISIEYASCLFDPDCVPEPDMGTYPIGGMGIHFMRLVMDKVDYEFRDDCVVLTLTKLADGAAVRR